MTCASENENMQVLERQGQINGGVEGKSFHDSAQGSGSISSPTGKVTMRKLVSLLGAFVAFAWYVTPQRSDAQTVATDQAQIRTAYQHFIEAFNLKNVPTIMSFYVRGSDLFVFDVTPPRQHVGWEDYKKDWEDLFAAFPGPLHQEITDLSVTVDGKVAYSHCIVSGFFTRHDGSRLTVAVRTTDVLRKLNGTWLDRKSVV